MFPTIDIRYTEIWLVWRNSANQKIDFRKHQSLLWSRYNNFFKKI